MGHPTKRGSVASARRGGLVSAVSLDLQYFIRPLFHGILSPTSDALWECSDVRITGTKVG